MAFLDGDGGGELFFFGSGEGWWSEVGVAVDGGFPAQII
jgi:hypothetical protein